MISYKQRESIIHSLDPRFKLVSFALVVFALLLNSSLASALLGLALVFFLYMLARIRLDEFYNDAAGLMLITAIPIPLHALSVPGTPALEVFGIVFSEQGVLFGAATAVYLMVVLSLTILFLYTTKRRKVVSMMVWFKVPADMALATSISLRFIPIIQEQVQEIRVSQAARGHRLAGLLSPIPVFVPALHGVFKRAREMSFSMESRGFDPENIRISTRFNSTASDYLVLLLMAFSSLALLIV